MALSFAADGIEVLRGVVPRKSIDRLAALPELAQSNRPGGRAFEVPSDIRGLIESDGPLGRLATQLLGRGTRPVRVLFFDKTTEANWGVPWHQDRSLPVAARVEAPGMGPWTVKHGVPRAEMPVGVLEQLVSLRLHIDPCGEDAGPLLALPGSFRLGRMPDIEIKRLATSGDRAMLTANPADVVAMRDLTIHASGHATRPSRRRVIHVDFCAAELPAGLSWQPI